MSLEQAIADLPPEKQTIITSLYRDCEVCLINDGAAPEDITHWVLRSHIVIQAVTGNGERHGFTITYQKQPPFEILCRVHCIQGPATFIVT